MRNMTSRGRFKCKRSVIGADGMSVVKEFVQRTGESKASVTRRANTWQVEARGKQPSPSMKLAQAIDLFNEYRTGQFARSTQKDDLWIGSILKQELGQLGIQNLTSFAVDALTRRYQDKPRTAKKLRDFGRKLYNWLAKRKWVESNPFAEADAVAYSPEKWQEPISDEHFEKTVAQIQNPVFVGLLTLLRWVPIRPISARSLLWSELEYRDGHMYIRKQSAKTTAGTRIIPVPHPAQKAIEAQPRSALFVFTSPKTGRPYTESPLRQEWHEAQERAGLEPRALYDLKHMRLTELHELFGGDDVKVAAVSGLQSVQSIKNNYLQIEMVKLSKKVRDGEQMGNTPKENKDDDDD